MQRRARQSDAALRFLSHLRETGEHVLDACTGLGDAPVASFLCFRERLVLAALALDEHAPARARQPRFAFAIDVTLVGQYGPAGVGRIQYGLKVIGVVFARRADLELANQLVALVRVRRQLVAEIGLAVFLRPARLEVLLAPLRRRPVGMALSSTRAMYPCFANWRLTASNTLSLAPALINRFLNVQIFVRSGIWLVSARRARRKSSFGPAVGTPSARRTG